MTTAPAAPRGWSTGRPGLAVFLGTGLVVAALNAGFQRLAAGRVDVDDLGALNALLAVVGGIGLLGLGLQVVLARAGMARLAIGRAAAVVAVAAAVLSAAVLPGPAWYRAAVGAALGATFAAVGLGVPHRARLLADASWRRLAAAYFAGAAVRLAAVPPLFAVIDNRVVGCMVATWLGESATSTVAYVLARPQYRGAWAGPPHRIDSAAGRLLVRSSLALGGLWLLTVADTVIARARLDAAGADAYAFASTVARASFFLALLVTHLALPTFMGEHGRSTSLRRAFAVTTTTVAAGAAVVGGVVVIAPRWSATRLLGADAAVVEPATLRLLTVAWALMSILPLLTYFHLGRHPRLAFVPIAGAVLSILGGAFVDTPRALAGVVLTAVVVTVVVMGLPASQRLTPVTRAATWHDGDGDRAVARRPAGDLGIVMPFFNPGADVVVDTVTRLTSSLRAAGIVHHVIAVSDGSTDGSAEVLIAAGLRDVDVIVLPENRGKGAALRTGLAQVHGELVGYIDADGDLPPEQVVGMVQIASATGADAVVASKLHPDSHLDVEGYRRALSRVFRALVRVLFRLDVRDTQTGLKLYRGDVLTEIVPLLREDGFAIDVEILVAAMRARRVSIVEAPVRIARGATTTVSARRAAATIGALVRIFWRDHVALAYEPGAAAPLVAAVAP